MITTSLFIGQGKFDSRRCQNCLLSDVRNVLLRGIIGPQNQGSNTSRILSSYVMAWRKRQVQICSLNCCEKCPLVFRSFCPSVSHFRLEIDFLISQKRLATHTIPYPSHMDREKRSFCKKYSTHGNPGVLKMCPTNCITAPIHRSLKKVV